MSDNTAARPTPAELLAREELRRVGGEAGAAPAAAMLPPPVALQPPTASGPIGAWSVIGSDLKISGQQLTITSKAPLRIDGQIQGDVRGTEVVIGEHGRVDGSVAAETIVVRGTAIGVVRGAKVTLERGSRVDGDVIHASLSVEQGAVFEGRARRHADPSELVPDLDVGADVVPLPRVFAGGRR